MLRNLLGAAAEFSPYFVSSLDLIAIGLNIYDILIQQEDGCPTFFIISLTKHGEIMHFKPIFIYAVYLFLDQSCVTIGF